MENAIALIGIVVVLLAQTGALAFWGGKVHHMLKEHQRRLQGHDDRLDQLDRRKS